MKINISDKKSCSGCTACATACPRNAITMQADSMGFKYPKVNEFLCSDCGLCVKKCQFIKEYKRYQNYKKPKVFGVRHIDSRELMLSQSGAASWAFIQTFLNYPGVVYGASCDNNHTVKHTKATEVSDCNKFRYSKYVQSDINGIFPEIKADLSNGKRILFIGTPCQVAGLKSFIPVSLQHNLTCIDLICHGVSSPLVWNSYIKYIEHKYGKIDKVLFRNKKFGWHSHKETFFIGKKNIVAETFKTMYQNHSITRPSCSACPYANLNRVGDITIGDFWGWEKSHTEWNDNNGVSLVLLNNIKGEELFDLASQYLLTIPSTVEECLQPRLKGPIQVDSNMYIEVEREFTKNGFASLAKKYGDFGIKNKIFKIYQNIYRFYYRMLKR